MKNLGIIMILGGVLLVLSGMGVLLGRLSLGLDPWMLIVLGGFCGLSGFSLLNFIEGTNE